MAFVGETLETLAKSDPQVPAISCAGRLWTRAQFFSEVLVLAEALQARVPKGARVALCLDDPVLLLIAFFAVARSGAIAMIYDPEWPQERRAWIDQSVQPALTLEKDSFDDVLTALMDEGLLSQGPRRQPDAQDPFYVGFTSGSTGVPKGYCRSHQSWLESFNVSACEFAIAAGDQVIIPGNMVHSLHLYGAVQGLCSGAHVDVAERFNPRLVAANLRQSVSAVFYATPTQIHYVAQELRRSGPALNLRLVLASGAKWRDADRIAMAAVFPAARLVEFYGASEMSFLTLATPEDNVPSGSVGRAANGVSLDIRSSAGETLAPGQTGLIWARSDMLFDGYICGGGSEIAWEDGWLTVGDLGFIDANGFLFLSGREKRMIVTSGVNIYPEEVEHTLLSHEGVALAAVVARPDPIRGSELVAVVSLETGAVVSEADLRRHCAERLGRSRTPRAFLFRSEFPLTPGGKIDLMRLEAELQNSEQAQ
ncbi:AMP-binding protein [Roseibium sp.]|uniref:class I adenylate-forming enzyme family protein n=1 Tax=Roseibium sp. TaxID=1936156 RepID=UPI0032675C5D